MSVVYMEILWAYAGQCNVFLVLERAEAVMRSSIQRAMYAYP